MAAQRPSACPPTAELGNHVEVIQDALAQIPGELIETIEIVVRADSAGATHELLDFCREHRLRYTVGYELTDPVRAAILKLPEDAWIAALASDGSERENGQIAEITTSLDLTAWPTGSRVIVRRERAHPGAQLSFTDHDGHRFQGVLTDQPDPDIQVLERRQRERAHAETQIRNDKDCQRPSVSPHGRPSDLPSGGHVFSSLAAMFLPAKVFPRAVVAEP